ncbi:MAG: dihydroorotate dehydrogenase B catalytic subunit [Candidatus Cloacimonadota bacterium]|nr:MAG: dihydroorotate dehydrogenase B catalytic subunit [Candidatus Cloacimonadota bacterium]PIE78576.1 MAG: dihydroorotate dehydrogenase B catalytic subunit [Candidatus Delongbacteria bacterium]
MNLNVDIGGVELKNPILTASGTFGYGDEFNEFFDISQLGGIVTKAITPEVRVGNPIPRIAETEYGMLNSIGLANLGLKEFLQKKIPMIKNFNTKVFINVAGKELKDYIEVAESLSSLDFLGGIELNISCPNVKEGGVAFGTDPKVAALVTKGIRKVYKKHLMIKLSPNVTDITEIAKAVEGEGCDSISLINTLFGMAIDLKTFKPKVKSIVAGYSGPGIKPIALQAVYKCSKAVKVPLIGMGGIMNSSDVVEFLLAGATAVQVGTANFTNPLSSINILNDLKLFMEKRGIKDINSLIGGMIV